MRIEEIRRWELADRLRGRREEIEQTVLARARSVSGAGDRESPEYVAGLRSAVVAAVGYAIAALESGGGRPAPVPVELLSQARRAASGGIPIDTVLRRYVAGHTLIDEFICQEAEVAGVDSAALLIVLRIEATSLDHLVTAITAEYRSELEAKTVSRHRRRSEWVCKLLDGELSDASGLDYDLNGWHLGLIATGSGAEREIKAVAGALERRFLFVQYGAEVSWAWLGGAQEPTEQQLETLAGWKWPSEVRLAIGEPGRGLPGWRLTHRQAAAALPIAQAGPSCHARYATVAMLASVLQDEVLANSLRDLYLTPLTRAPDGGLVLRQTLRSYFATGCNTTSAAAALAVDRRTVANRLRVVEEHLNRRLDDCAVDLQMALRLDELERHASTKTAA
ncbi:MAG TPA: helix-turn-helix domain-containing protein [Solirubrobacterales bacterium]|nr:helix-turn-helix domain-containing protein [Solirubrobacterales bacterium]